MDEQDKDGIHNLVQFLKETSDNPNTWLYTIKHLDVEVDKEFIISCIEKLLEKFPNSDFVKLHAAQCFIRLEELEKLGICSRVLRRKMIVLYIIS